MVIDERSTFRHIIGYVVLAKICGEKSLRFSISRKRRAINVDRRAMIYSMYLRFIGALCIGYGRQGD